LYGFTISEGNAADNGGGIWCSNASPKIVACKLTANNATGAGGAVFNINASPIIDSCVFINNTAGSGGAILNLYANSSPLIKNCMFIGDSATTGGAVYNQEWSSPTYINCSFTNNKGPREGAAIFNNTPSCKLLNCNFSNNTGAFAVYLNVTASVTITNCRFINNACKTSVSGGGLLCAGATGTISNCFFSGNDNYAVLNTPYINVPNVTFENDTFINNTVYGAMVSNGGTIITLKSCFFSHNSAQNGAGLNFSNNCFGFVNACTFVGNKATQSGGAVFSSASGINFTNCTFVGDTAPVGGGILNIAKSNTRLTNCTFTANVASIRGGAVYDSSAGSSDSTKSTLHNCIFWGNSAPANPEINCGAFTMPIIKNCVVAGGCSGPGTIDSIIILDPKLGPLQDNAGPVHTCAIPGDSPAKDAGTTNVPVGIDISTDARGFPRSDGKPDIGAYEVQ
jgi:hypothetical protein